MKKIFFLLIFSPVFVHAKGWEIGLGAGISANTRLDEFIESNNTRLKLGGAWNISVSKHVNAKLELGLDLNAIDLARIANSVTLNSIGINPPTYYDARMHIGKMGLLITPFISWHLNHFYVGGQAGYFTSIPGDDKYSSSHAQLYFNAFEGFCLGLHGGYNWKVSPNLHIFSELRANYIQAKMQNWYGFNTYQGSLIVGAKYAFKRAKKDENKKH